MPHHDDDLDDDATDLRDWLTRRVGRMGQPGGGHDPNWPPTGSKASSFVWARPLLLIALVIMIGLGWVAEDILFPPPKHNGGTTQTPAESTHVPDVPSQTLFAQRDVYVHTARSRNSAVIRTLKRGERVLATQRDGRKWLRVFEPDGDPIGYAYQDAGNLLQTSPINEPVTEDSP